MKPQDNSTDIWFTEAELPYSKQDIKISVYYTKLLYDEKSPFGHIQVFDTPFFGHMLALDGIIQVAEKDEFIYHEMMVALPALLHSHPKNILIIGGGDGGAAKQALRIKSVEKIVQVEIDENIVQVSEKFLPSVSEGALRNDKVELVIADGKEYIQNSKDKFDIVVLDLTDPLPGGPAEELFAEPFYQDVKRILSDDGIMTTHCGSLLFQPDEAKMLTNRLKRVFKEVTLHHAMIPTYQLSLFGFLVSSPTEHRIDKETITERLQSLQGKCKYLSPEIFFSSKVLPPYLEELVTP